MLHRLNPEQEEEIIRLVEACEAAQMAEATFRVEHGINGRAVITEAINEEVSKLSQKEVS